MRVYAIVALVVWVVAVFGALELASLEQECHVAGREFIGGVCR